MRDTLEPAQVRSLPAAIRKVGVFVDADLGVLQTTACQYQLDYVQLHGHETPDYCQQARNLGLHVIKAFAVDNDFDFGQLAAYEGRCDFFCSKSASRVFVCDSKPFPKEGRSIWYSCANFSESCDAVEMFDSVDVLR